MKKSILTFYIFVTVFMTNCQVVEVVEVVPVTQIVTQVVVATSTTIPPASEPSNEIAITSTPNLLATYEVLVAEHTPSALTSPFEQSSVDTPYFPTIEEYANFLLENGINTIRMNLRVSVPIIAEVDTGEIANGMIQSEIDELLQQNQISGNFFIDVNVAKLTEGKWNFTINGGIATIVDEFLIEIRQTDSELWQKVNDGEWTVTDISSHNDPLSTLGRIEVDSYKNTIGIGEFISRGIDVTRLNTQEALVAENWEVKESESGIMGTHGYVIESDLNVDSIKNIMIIANPSLLNFIDRNAIINNVQADSAIEQVKIPVNEIYVHEFMSEERAFGIVPFSLNTAGQTISGSISLFVSLLMNSEYEYLPSVTQVSPPY